MKTLWFKDRYAVLDRAVSLAPDEGLILEFGVATGTTIRLLAKLFHPRRVYGFDSFEGLPEDWGHYRAGHFACAPPDVPSNVDLVAGLFAETLPDFLAAHPGRAALVHIDCDLYSSTRTVLDLLSPRIVPGTVIVLDEYWIMEDHERRAFDEFVVNRTYRFDSRAYEQACVIML
jgi:predicted O-methyltransferase YrrM